MDDQLEALEEDLPESINPLAARLPADPAAWSNARAIASGSNIRINELADAITQDPVLTLETIGAANAQFYAGERPSIANVRTALFRLGTESGLTVLDRLKSRRCPHQSAAVQLEYLKLVFNARRASKLSALIAQLFSRDLAEDAQTAGLFSYLGLMLACYRFGDEYVEMVERLPRPTVVYRLSNDYNFSVRDVQLSYLQTHGIPQSLWFIFDRDFSCKTPSQSVLRFSVEAAVELVDAYDADKWGRYAPDGDLPAKSVLRLMRLSAQQHEVLYTAATEILERMSVLRPAFSDEQENVDDQVEAAEVAPVEDVVPIEYIEAGEEERRDLPSHFSDEARETFALLGQLINESSTVDDLLQKLLLLLVEKGPFERAALLTLEKNRKLARIHTAVGAHLSKSIHVPVRDALSPLALGSSSVKSFNSPDSVNLSAPFGVTAYALSPIRVSFSAPVILYADCGDVNSLPFEARRIFRMLVGILNITLPRLPGGLPKGSFQGSSTVSAVN